MCEELVNLIPNTIKAFYIKKKKKSQLNKSCFGAVLSERSLAVKLQPKRAWRCGLGLRLPAAGY